MIDLTTNYLGLHLKNPIIVGSCSMTTSIEEIVDLEQNGAAAIVLKSIFEEEILNEAKFKIDEAKKSDMIYSQLSETLDYIDMHVKGQRLSEYITLIKEAKKKTLIPIIASINCITDSEWTDFAKKIEQAGADALELNVFLNPSNFGVANYEKLMFDIVKKVLNAVKIPVVVKLGNCFTNLAQTIVKLSKTGISGLVLFNRFYSLDIDIYNMQITTGKMLSNADDYGHSLRWIALMSNKVDCSLAASTGVHHGNAVIKQILAGADAVQIVTTLYLNGKPYINQILADIEKWMNEKGIFSLSQVKGKSSYDVKTDPSVYERMHFMKQFGRIN